MNVNAERLPRDVVVVGGSAGALEVVLQVLAGLPRDLPAIIALVIHRKASGESSLLYEIVARRSPLSVIEPHENEPVRLGTVYVAPADRHLVFHDGVARLSRGAQEHRFRPAIDPLFVSASRAYGQRVLGILLSGGGSDGVLGLTAIKAAGGLCLVQDPSEAAVNTMPVNALQKDQVDGFVSTGELMAILPALVNGQDVKLSPRQSAALRDDPFVRLNSPKDDRGENSR